jgi:uncharacterized protein DUF3631
VTHTPDNNNERNTESNVHPFLSDPAPWREIVTGTELLNELTTAICRHVILEEGAAAAVALWIVHAHALDAFPISPRLAISSALPGCGKTTLLDIVALLTPRPLMVANLTAAAAFYVIHDSRPTLLIDEADTFLAQDRVLRGILNSGHNRRAARILRRDKWFSTWAAVAIAMIGELPGTLADRSIQVRLTRRRAEETILPFRSDKVDHLIQLASKATRWATDNAQHLRAADPEIPDVLQNRDADNWRPLVAIADVVGGDWPQRARLIAQSMAAKRASTPVEKLMLLQDICAVFMSTGANRMTSAEVATRLAGLDGRPWSEWRGGMPITKKAIANLLAPFDIQPVELRVGAQVLRGYYLEQFEDAFARYVKDAKPVQTATPLHNRTAA